MNKRQKIISKTFNLWFPLAVKNGGINPDHRKKEFRSFKWAHSTSSIEEILEEKAVYQAIKKAQNSNC